MAAQCSGSRFSLLRACTSSGLASSNKRAVLVWPFCAAQCSGDQRYSDTRAYAMNKAYLTIRKV